MRWITALFLACLIVATLRAGDGRKPNDARRHRYATARDSRCQRSPPSSEELRAIASNFAAAHAKINQVARWYKPVCPNVENLPPGYADFVERRIRAIAKSVGAPTKEPCKPNIEIMFTARPQVVMD